MVRLVKKSPFPAGFLGVDLNYDGIWNPLGADLDQAGVSARHGATSEGGAADVSSLAFTVKNGDGKYSPRNPNSPLFTKIGRNAPARATVSLGAPWLDLPAGSTAYTADTVANSITGDIDIRWWGYRDDWSDTVGLFAKWDAATSNRSWLLEMVAGVPKIYWSANGITPRSIIAETAIPAWAGEVAIRVTLDVNNGASGVTATFYYSESLAGTWIQLGAPVVSATTSSIFNSTTVVQLYRNGGFPESPQRVLGWELRNGISGTLVSSADTSTFNPAVPLLFQDVQAQTWAIIGGASVTNKHTLAGCEVAEWPMDWNRKGAESVLTGVQAAGVTRRLGQGAAAVDSAIYRSIMSEANPNLLAYWPMEDGADATSFGQAVGAHSVTWAGSPELATYVGFGGSNPLPTMGDTRIRFPVDTAPITAGLQVRHLLNIPLGGVAHDTPLLDINLRATGGTDLATVRVAYETLGELRLDAFDSDGVYVGGTPGGVSFGVDADDIRVSVQLIQNGANVDYVIGTVNVISGTGLVYSGTITGRPLTPLRDIIFNRNRVDLGQTAIGHLTVENSISTVYSIPGTVLGGYVGEQADTRLKRLAAEQGVALTQRGGHAGTATMGRQGADTLLGLLAQGAEADGGLLHDAQPGVALRYRSLHSMGSQPAVTIPYSDNRVVPFDTTDDDNLTRNRVTVSRPNGVRMTSELAAGTLSIQPAPFGVGLYDEALERNYDTDVQAGREASWRVHVGTWDEGRYPTLGVDLAHPYFLAHPVLTRELLSLTPGDRLVITDPPPWLPPNSVDVLVMGIQVDVTPLSVRLTWTCVPARPYRVGYWNAGHRWSAAGSTLESPITATGTSLNIDVGANPYAIWACVDGEYNIVINGEVMTVTYGLGDNQLSVIRSVNGVVKDHPEGSYVYLAEPSFYAR